MFEAQALDGVVQFNIDTEIIGIQLQLIARAETACRIDIEQQSGDRAVQCKPPMAVALRCGAKIDHAHGSGALTLLRPVRRPIFMVGGHRFAEII